MSIKHLIMDSHDMERSLTRMALQILEENGRASKLALVGIHTGGVFLANRLQEIIRKHEGIELPVATLDITLYRDDWSLITQNPVVRTTSIPFGVEDYTLVLVDDVLFTGRTIRAALDAIMDLGRPRAIHLAVLINRGCGRELPISPNYMGFDVQEGITEHVHVRFREKDEIDEVTLESRG